MYRVAVRVGRPICVAVLVMLGALGVLSLSDCSGETHLEVLASNRHQARGDAWPLEREAFLQIVNKAIQPGWHVVITPISERSFAAESLYDESLPAYSIVGTNLYQQEVAKKKAQADLKKVLALLDANRAGTDRTEIISAVSASAERFNVDKTATKKVLLVLSSGFEQSSVVNMADYRLNLDEPAAERFVNHLKTLGTMPHLTGVEVCMAGITSGDHQWADHKRLLNIQRFWRAFFTSAGAEVISYAPNMKGCSAIPR